MGLAVGRLLKQFSAVKNVVMSKFECHLGRQQHKCPRRSFSEKGFYARLLFIKNIAEILTDFLSLFEARALGAYAL